MATTYLDNMELEDRQYHKNLSAKDIDTIRELYLNNLTQREIGKQFNISLKAVYNIVQLLNYKWVSIKGMTEAQYRQKLEERNSK